MEDTKKGTTLTMFEPRKGHEEVKTTLSRRCVCIVVLGDIGRSPRMRYHALSLAKEGYFVHFIGYGGTALPDDIRDNPSIWVDYMTEAPTALQCKHLTRVRSQMFVNGRCTICPLIKGFPGCWRIH